MLKKLLSLFLSFVLIFCTLPVTIYANPNECSIPSDAFEFQGHYYKIYEDVADTWEDAKVFCENLGGHLATVNYDEENKMLYSYITSCGYKNAYFGYTDSQEEDTWLWVTDENINYTNWAQNEPNNSGNEDYAMFYWKFPDGTWNDGNFGHGTQADQKAFICEWGEGAQDKTSNDGIAVLSTERSLTVRTGEEMWLGFGVVEDGLLKEDWKKMALSVGDPTIISLSDYEETEYGYTVSVKGLKEGFSSLTITDTESGMCKVILISVYDKYSKTYSYEIDDVPTFYPQNKYENDIKTNIYDLNGIYISDYAYQKRGDKYTVSFNAYNANYHAAAVDVFDADGNWHSSHIIDKKTDITNLYDTIDQTFSLIGNSLMAIVPGGQEGNLLTYKQKSFAKHTPLVIEVPEGGYFHITNNSASSPGVFFYNASELLFDASLNLLDAVINGVDLKGDFAKMILEKIITDTDTRSACYEIFKNSAESILSDFAKKIMNGSINQGASAITASLEDILSSIKIDWRDVLKTILNVGETALTKFFGPAGITLEACFNFSKHTSELQQVMDMASSLNEPYAVICTETEEGFITSNGIIVNTQNNVNIEAKLQVFKVFGFDASEILSDSREESCEIYNICFAKDDKNVQPSGNVTVKIPAPKGLDPASCKVLRQEENGSWTQLNSYLEGGYLVFDTPHFSYYAVAGKKAKLTIVSSPKKLMYSPGERIDTEGLELSINGKTITSGFICSPSVFPDVDDQIITVQYAGETATFVVEKVVDKATETIVATSTIEKTFSSVMQKVIRAVLAILFIAILICIVLLVARKRKGKGNI